MQRLMLLTVAAVLSVAALGCGGSSSTPISGNALNTDQVAEQEAVLNEAEATERARMYQQQ